jgi:hypothetical protein
VGERIGKARGFSANMPSSSPPRSRTERKEGGAVTAGRLGCPPAAPAAATAGDEGKRERRARGTYSRAHLGLLRTVEAAPRESRGAAAALGGGGAVVLGEEGRRRCEAVMMWCGEPGRPSAPFIGGERRFGSGDISPASSTPASSRSFARRRPGDATARAVRVNVHSAWRGAGGSGGLRCRPEVTARLVAGAREGSFRSVLGQ